MKEETVVAIMVGVASGVIGAYVGNQTIRRIQEQIHQEELSEARIEGYKEGFNHVAQNPDRMRRLLDKLSDQG